MRRPSGLLRWRSNLNQQESKHLAFCTLVFGSMCCCHILWEFHGFAVDGAWTETITCVGLFHDPVWFGPLCVTHGAGVFARGIRLLINTVQKILLMFIQHLLRFPGINSWQMTERIWLSVSMYVRREFLPVKYLEDAWDLLSFIEACMV